MADGRWVMTENELNNVACGFDDGTKRRTLENLPNYKKHMPVDNRKGQAQPKCAFCGSDNLESGFGGYGEGFGYKSSRCLDCGGTTDFVYEDNVNRYGFGE